MISVNSLYSGPPFRPKDLFILSASFAEILNDFEIARVMSCDPRFIICEALNSPLSTI